MVVYPSLLSDFRRLGILVGRHLLPGAHLLPLHRLQLITRSTFQMALVTSLCSTLRKAFCNVSYVVALCVFFIWTPWFCLFVPRPWRWLHRWTTRILWRAQVRDGRTVWKPGRAGEAQCTYIYRVPLCMSPRQNWALPIPSLASEYAPPPGTKGGGGAYSPAGEGLAESKFQRLEKKLGNLPTLWGEGMTNSVSTGSGSVIICTDQDPPIIQQKN